MKVQIRQLLFISTIDPESKKIVFDIGEVIETYDQVVLMFLRNSRIVSACKINDIKEDFNIMKETGVMFLTLNGEYAIKQQVDYGEKKKETFLHKIKKAVMICQ